MAGARIEAPETEEPEPATQPAAPSSPTAGAADLIQQAETAASQTATSSQPVAAAPAQAESEYTGLLDYYKTNLGLDLSSQFQDDRQAAQALADSYRNYQAIQNDAYYQQFRQQAPKFHEWLGSQQQAQPVQRQTGAWAPPATEAEVNQLLSAYYQRDAQGQWVPTQNTPFDVRKKVEDYANYLRNWEYGVRHKPKDTLEPLIREIVEPLLAARDEQYRNQVQTQEAIRRNQEWLYERDGQGNQLYMPDGQPLLSQTGRMFAGYVKEAQKIGIQGVAEQEHYALRMTNSQMIFDQQAPAQAAQTGAKNRQNVIDKANRRANTATNAGGAPTAQPVDTGAGGLAKMIRQAFTQESISDNDVAYDFAGVESN